jgi:AAA family ATP:ADP antiporter
MTPQTINDTSTALLAVATPRSWLRELGRLTHLTVAFFMVITALYVVRPASGALVVKSTGAIGMPGLALATSATIVLVSLLFVSSDWLRLRLSIVVGSVALLGLVVLALFPFLWQASGQSRWCLYFLLLSLSVVTSAATYCVWMLLTTIVIAIRWYHVTVFGLGAQIGAILGAGLSQLLMKTVAVYVLPAIAAGGYTVGFALIIIAIVKYRCYGTLSIPLLQPDVNRRRVILNDVLCILRNPYLRLLVLVICAQVVLADSIQWRLYILADSAKNIGAAAGLLARFYQYQGYFSIGVQLLVVPVVFRVLTPRFGIVLQPVLAVVAVILLGLSEGAVVISAIVAAYKGLDYTLNNSVREALYSPLPLVTKVYPRALLAMAVPRVGVMLASALMLAFGMLGNCVWTAVLVGIAATWLGLAVVIGRLYYRLQGTTVVESASSVDAVSSEVGRPGL